MFAFLGWKKCKPSFFGRRGGGGGCIQYCCAVFSAHFVCALKARVMLNSFIMNTKNLYRTMQLVEPISLCFWEVFCEEHLWKAHVCPGFHNRHKVQLTWDFQGEVTGWKIHKTSYSVQCQIEWSTLTFLCTLAQPTSALNDVTHPHLPSCCLGWVQQCSLNVCNKAAGFAYTVYFSSHFLLTRRFAWKTLATGSISRSSSWCLFSLPKAFFQAWSLQRVDQSLWSATPTQP